MDPIGPAATVGKGYRAYQFGLGLAPMSRAGYAAHVAEYGLRRETE
jgi:hypothetical protein